MEAGPLYQEPQITTSEPGERALTPTAAFPPPTSEETVTVCGGSVAQEPTPSSGRTWLLPTSRPLVSPPPCLPALTALPPGRPACPLRAVSMPHGSRDTQPRASPVTGAEPASGPGQGCDGPSPPQR